MLDKIHAIIADLSKMNHEIDQIHQQVDHESLALKMALACLQAAVYTASIAATNVLGHIKQ
jgi:predicted amino acid-binding ACT domain protein